MVFAVRDSGRERERVQPPEQGDEVGDEAGDDGDGNIAPPAGHESPTSNHHPFLPLARFGPDTGWWWCAAFLGHEGEGGERGW